MLFMIPASHMTLQPEGTHSSVGVAVFTEPHHASPALGYEFWGFQLKSVAIQKAYSASEGIDSHLSWYSTK